MVNLITRFMDKTTVISLCKYYKGEAENPFKDDKHPLWKLEKVWVDEATKDEPSTLLIDYCIEFANSFPEWANDKVIPMSLKALLLSRYIHLGGNDDGFKAWIKRYYRIK